MQIWLLFMILCLMLLWWLVWVIVRQFLRWRLLKLGRFVMRMNVVQSFLSQTHIRIGSIFSAFIIFLISFVNIIMAVDSRIANVAVIVIIIYLVFTNFLGGVSNVWIDIYLPSRPSSDWMKRQVFSAHLNTVSVMYWVPWASRPRPESITTRLLNWPLLLVVCFMYFGLCVLWFL